MNVALAAPRLSASIPTLPVPPKRSRKRAFSTRVERISKRAVLTRSRMGRVPTVLGALSLRPLASPVMTRILLRLDQGKHGFHLTHKIILLGPGNQGLHLVGFQFLQCRGSP